MLVRVVDGRIAELRAGAGDRADARAVDGTLLPGFVDLQVNGMGGAGFEAEDDAAFGVAARAVKAGGAAAFLPTLITAPLDVLARRAGKLARWIARGTPADAATPLGIHLEGPFLELAGAHDAQALVEPTPSRVDRLVDACAGTLRLVTLAPGLPGAVEAVARLRKAGVAVAFGHARSTQRFLDCVSAGASVVTHLFNAMSGIHHRDPGIVGLALDTEKLSCCLIPDGVHVQPAVLRVAWRVLGPTRMVLVTDATSASGMPDGEYTLSGSAVTSKDGVVTNRSGTIAGSALTMRDGVQRFLRFVPGLDAADVTAIAATNPARIVGATEFGSIAAGMRAAFVELRDDGTLREVALA